MNGVYEATGRRDLDEPERTWFAVSQSIFLCGVALRTMKWTPEGGKMLESIEFEVELLAVE